jgi:5,10-methylene-tetrahydrofolate dehydrogenase/methenyl tetrahydrofolate cyclohydrolase
MSKSRTLGAAIAFAVLSTAALATVPANAAVVYCKTAGVPQGCVVRTAPVVVAPVVRPVAPVVRAAVVAPGATVRHVGYTRVTPNGVRHVGYTRVRR